MKDRPILSNKKDATYKKESEANKNTNPKFDLRQAFILKEIMDKPLSLRKRGR